MESGLFAGAPGAPEDAPQTQTPEAPQAPEPTPAPQSEQPQTGEQPDNEVLAAIQRLEQRIDNGGTQQPSQETDLLDALLGEPESEEEPASPEQTAPTPQQGDPAQAELEELRNFVRAEAEQMAQAQITPYIQQQNEREIRGLQQEFPDIVKPEILQPLEKTVEEFIQTTGDESLKFNPDFVRKAYRMVKAEQADASAVPAEQAATNGASLETNGGQAQAGAADPSDTERYKQLVYGTGTKAEF